MENINEVFDKEIEQAKEKVKSVLESKAFIMKSIKKLKQELKRKERAKTIYFGDKVKKVIKKEKSEINSKEVKP